jgi:hypothetical protein
MMLSARLPRLVDACSFVVAIPVFVPASPLGELGGRLRVDRVFLCPTLVRKSRGGGEGDGGNTSGEYASNQSVHGFSLSGERRDPDRQDSAHEYEEM